MKQMINDKMRDPNVLDSFHVNLWAEGKDNVRAILPLDFAKKLMAEGTAYAATTSDVVYVGRK